MTTHRAFVVHLCDCCPQIGRSRCDQRTPPIRSARDRRIPARGVESDTSDPATSGTTPPNRPGADGISEKSLKISKKSSLWPPRIWGEEARGFAGPPPPVFAKSTHPVSRGPAQKRGDLGI